MAKIIDNYQGRRMIRLSVDDVVMIIGQYQQLCASKILEEPDARRLLSKNFFYLPEDI